MGVMKQVMGKMRDEIVEEQKDQMKRHGTGFAGQASMNMLDSIEEADDRPQIKLGDASIAAPFTSRTPSIASVVNIIRQGRCTLLSAIQQMQIMMLDSMISAYALSAMSADGTRPSEQQMMASGTLMSVASMAFSFARPLEKMHRVRPLSSCFHPALFASIMGQMIIHLFVMVYIVSLAKEAMGEKALKEVLEFEKNRHKAIDNLGEEEFEDMWWFMKVPFKPNLLNTMVWLVETSQQVAVLFVNYKGQPWMKGLLENQALFLSLTLCT